MDFNYRSVSIGNKLNTILFPIDNIILLRSLSKEGFILPESIWPPPPGFGAKLELRGVVARKGEISISLDESKQVISVHAPDIKSVIAELSSLEAILLKELGLDIKKFSLFYELLIEVKVQSSNEPIKCLQRHFEQCQILKDISKIIGAESSVYGLRFAPKNEDPNRADFYDIQIEPDIKLSHNTYHIRSIYRHSKKEITINYANNFQVYIEKIIQKLETK